MSRRPDHVARTQLHSAAQDGNLELVKQLLAQNHPVNRMDELGFTPLHYAAMNEHLDVVDHLLAAGAFVNTCDEPMAGNTVLRQVIEDCSYAIAKRLVEAGADPTIPGWMRLTSLDCADRRTDADAPKIQQLLHRAADQLKRTPKRQRRR